MFADSQFPCQRAWILRGFSAVGFSIAETFRQQVRESGNMATRRKTRKLRSTKGADQSWGRRLQLELLEDRWTPAVPDSIVSLRPNRAYDPITSLTYSIPTPSKPTVFDAAIGNSDDGGTRAPPLTATFDGLDFDATASLNGGTQFIPAGPSGAVGPNHVVGAVNGAIRWSNKSGGAAVSKKLGNSGGIAGAFFDLAGTANDPTTPLFAPKVIFDQFANRFVVTAMEQTTSPTQTSFLFVAVSQTSDPNGAWNFARINSNVTISGVATYADSPGLAVDNQAVYISTNQFSFGDSFLGNRLFVVPKGIGTGGIYDVGGVATNLIFNPPGSAGAPNMTYAPAQIFGTAPAGVGTWLVAYSAMSDGSNEFVGVIRVDNPLGTPTFSFQLLGVGDIDNTANAIPQAPQSGTATLLNTGDDSALQAVWRNNSLYATTTVVPTSGVDANQATAHWLRLGTTTLSALTVAEQGNLSGNDIASATHTFYPSIAVDSSDNVAFGFAASAASVFPGAYYTGRESGDPAGTVVSSGTLKVGDAFYVQTLGTGDNRWGDYSSAAVDPSDGTFWLFNQYAKTQAVSGTERGRWGTRWGRFQFDQVGPTVTSVGPVTPDPRNTSVSTVDVTFSELIRLAEFTTADLTLTRNAANVSFSGNETFTFVSGTTYRIGGLAEETNPEGTYVLTVNAAGIPDNSGNSGTGTGSDTFVVDKTSPTVVQVIPVSPDPRTSAIASIDVQFSEPIDLASFRISSITLTLDGNAVSFSGNESASFVSGNIFRMNGLGEETGGEGVYVLTVNAGDVADPAGNVGFGTASDTWRVDRTAPTVDLVGPVTPDPRNTAVASIDVRFSETIDLTSFTVADLSLTRNGSPVTFSGNETIVQIASDTYTVGGLSEETGVAGPYAFTVNSVGIKDLAGIFGSNADFDTWTVDLTAPKIANVFFDGTSWSAAFRTAAGSSNGYPAQSGSGQLVGMPWSTVNVIRVQFSENVSVQSNDIGIRGINVANYSVSSFSYNSATFIASWTLSAAIDTDRVLIDLDGDSGTAVLDAATNKLAGTWTEGVSTFPTAGSAAQDFKYRFVIAVGDGNRDGLVRNSDVNAVRANLFVDAGQAGYNIFLDIDGNGQTRNADINAVRSHLFFDPPSGPGPFRQIRGAATRGRPIIRGVEASDFAVHGTETSGDEGASHRRPGRNLKSSILDAVFATEL